MYRLRARFRLFVLASSGRETRDHAFTVESLVRHARTMLTALDRLEQHGYRFGVRRIDVLATPERQQLGLRVAEAFGSMATTRPLEHPYYSGGLRYQIWVTAPDGMEIPLIDGGTFDWVSKLAANRRAVYVALEPVRSSSRSASAAPMFEPRRVSPW